MPQSSRTEIPPDPSPRVGLHRPDDPNVASDFDASVEIDRGRESSNGGYLASQFRDDELTPPLAPYAHTYQGGHAPPSEPAPESTADAPNPSPPGLVPAANQDPKSN